MPESLSWKFFECDYITSLPLWEIFNISCDKFFCEYFSFSRKKDVEISYATKVNIRIKFCVIYSRIRANIFIDKFSDTSTHRDIECSTDDISTYSGISWWISAIRIVSIRKIICFYDSNLSASIFIKELCFFACGIWNSKNFCLWFCRFCYGRVSNSVITSSDNGEYGDGKKEGSDFFHDSQYKGFERKIQKNKKFLRFFNRRNFEKYD